MVVSVDLIYLFHWRLHETCVFSNINIDACLAGIVDQLEVIIGLNMQHGPLTAWQLCVYMILPSPLGDHTLQSYKLKVDIFCSKNWTFQIHITK